MTGNSVPLHPGSYVRKNVLDPRGLTVTEVAKLIGVSRPSVSNFLNGKVSTTPDMAARLERTFGISAKAILDMQTAHMTRKLIKRQVQLKRRALTCLLFLMSRPTIS